MICLSISISIGAERLCQLLQRCTGLLSNLITRSKTKINQVCCARMGHVCSVCRGGDEWMWAYGGDGVGDASEQKHEQARTVGGQQPSQTVQQMPRYLHCRTKT